MWGDGRNATLLGSPNIKAKAIAKIPNTTFVQSEFFTYLWRRVTWKGKTGYIQAKYLVAYDPSPIHWKQRYGEHCDSVFMRTSTPEQVKNLKEDLSNFFSPYQHQLNTTDIFDEETKGAIRRFQLIYGLFVDGVATPETKATLMAYLPNRYRK